MSNFLVYGPIWIFFSLWLGNWMERLFYFLGGESLPTKFFFKFLGCNSSLCNFKKNYIKNKIGRGGSQPQNKEKNWKGWHFHPPKNWRKKNWRGRLTAPKKFGRRDLNPKNWKEKKIGRKDLQPQKKCGGETFTPSKIKNKILVEASHYTPKNIKKKKKTKIGGEHVHPQKTKKKYLGGGTYTPKKYWEKKWGGETYTPPPKNWRKKNWGGTLFPKKLK